MSTGLFSGILVEFLSIIPLNLYLFLFLNIGNMRGVALIIGFLFSTILHAQVEVALLGTLPEQVQETSGLAYYNNKLYTHNDSGNAAEIYEIDTLTLAVTRTIRINNAQNVDWEDLSRDDTYLYIGDIGNNRGERQDLLIYRIALADLDQASEVTAEIIRFSYADQTDFTPQNNSDWDAEALLCYGDQLIIFTKQWQSLGTVAYVLPKQPGDHIATPVGSSAVNGLVTGSVFNPEANVIYLVGYSSLLKPFLYRISDLPVPFVLTGNGTRYSLTTGFAQMEAITVAGENSYYLSSEVFSSNNPPLNLNTSLFVLTTDDVSEEPPEDDGTGNEENTPQLSFYVPFGTKSLEFTLQPDQEILRWEIFDLSGQRVAFLSGDRARETTIDVSPLSSSIYYLILHLQGSQIGTPFFLD